MTLNINGMRSDTKISMLEELLWKQSIDVALLQEVTTKNITNIRGYTTYLNEGTTNRGTALVTKEGINVTSIKRIPTGRGMAAHINNMWIINVYAPSGAERKVEREKFYNMDIIQLLSTTHDRTIIAGDFNCIQNKTGCTGTPNHSKALGSVIQALGLIDAWTESPAHYGYTHYTTKGASRIDRIYGTKAVMAEKMGIETAAAVFTDHNAVIIRLATGFQLPTRGRGFWKMNPTLMWEQTFCDHFQNMWRGWNTKTKYYTTRVMWWTRLVKRRIRQLFIAEGAERKKDRRQMEEFYYAALNSLMSGNMVGPATLTKLKELKAKILRLHGLSRQQRLIDTDEKDSLNAEIPTIYHIMRTKKRQDMRNVTRITDNNGNTHVSIMDIIRTFTEYMKEKYGNIHANTDMIKRMSLCIPTKLSTDAAAALEEPITMEELQTAVRAGKNRKAPGCDGIGHEFYKRLWDIIKHDLLTIIQQMHTEHLITTQQKHGILVCLPKTTTPERPGDYRALTLLNADFKLLARILAKRISGWIPDIIHPSQQCGVAGKTILDATATIRDAIAYAETRHKSLCVLSLDFQAAFDNISHTYLYAILEAHGLNADFQKHIRSMYDGATTSIQINGHISSPITIQCGIRQGCPLVCTCMPYA
jgi:exonuclease III